MKRMAGLAFLAALAGCAGCVSAQVDSSPNPRGADPGRPATNAVAAVRAPAPVLRAGFAVADLSPEPFRSLVGYGFRDEGNDGVADPLLARVLVVRDGTNTPAAIVSLDLAFVESDQAGRLRREVAAELRTPVERVLVCAVHTHSAQYPTRRHMEASVRPDVMEAVRRAAGLLFPVRAFVREAPLGFAYDRRVKMPDGKVRHCWGPQEWPDRRPNPARDPTCSVLLFRQENGPRSYVLWSAGAHPVVLGKTSRVVSGDYPGQACRLIERYIAGARAIFTLGAAGDAQPWIATQEDPAQVETVARCAASFVALLAQAVYPVCEETPELRTAGKTVTIGKFTLDLTVWRLGTAWIVATPGEMFQDLSLDLRRRLGGPVVIATIANGSAGYWPTKAAFAEGGYEVETARDDLKAGDSEKLIDELVALADGIREAPPVAEAAEPGRSVKVATPAASTNAPALGR